MLNHGEMKEKLARKIKKLKSKDLVLIDFEKSKNYRSKKVGIIKEIRCMAPDSEGKCAWYNIYIEDGDLYRNDIGYLFDIQKIEIDWLVKLVNELIPVINSVLGKSQYIKRLKNELHKSFSKLW